MAQVRSADAKSVLVLGAPLYLGRFPKDFHRFLKLHQHALIALRPWFFVLGPTRAEAKDFSAAQDQAQRQMSRYPWLHPADLRIFGGRWDPKQLPLPFNLGRRISRALDKIPAADIRDWNQIQEWAAKIARQCEALSAAS